MSFEGNNPSPIDYGQPEIKNVDFSLDLILYLVCGLNPVPNIRITKS